jgi:uncharacterized membrane protein
MYSACAKIIISKDVISIMIDMSRCDQKAIFTVVTVLLLFLCVDTAAAESDFEVESFNLTLYRDGLAHITQTLNANELSPEVTTPLLSSSIENLIVLDENDMAVDYEIAEGNLTIFTLGAQRVLVEYDTIELTKKDSEVWTLVTENPYSLTVSLPQNATVIYLNEMPTAIDTTGTGITLSLYPGHWEISYVVPLISQDDLNGGEGSSPSVPLEYLIAAIVAVAAVVILALMVVRGRRGIKVDKILKANPQLKQEDKDVILFLAEKDGKAFEAEIRERFSEMPRTSLWRLVRRLERLEIVEVKKIGLENQVQLKK